MRNSIAANKRPDEQRVYCWTNKACKLTYVIILLCQRLKPSPPPSPYKKSAVFLIEFFFLFCSSDEHFWAAIYQWSIVASLVYIFAGGATNHALETALEILIFLTFLNTVPNPMIYPFLSYEYRRAFNKICGRCFRNSNNNRWSRVNFITQE